MTYFDAVLEDVRRQCAKVDVQVEFNGGEQTAWGGAGSYHIGDMGYIVEGLEELETPAELCAGAVKDVLLQGLGMTPPGPLPAASRSQFTDAGEVEMTKMRVKKYGYLWAVFTVMQHGYYECRSVIIGQFDDCGDACTYAMRMWKFSETSR
jgi:hypothetical protein